MGVQQRLEQRKAAGGQQGIVFVDSEELPGAIRPLGRYKIQGNKITVRLALRRNDQVVDRIQLEGDVNEKAGLVARIVEAIRAASDKLPLVE